MTLRTKNQYIRIGHHPYSQKASDGCTQRPSLSLYQEERVLQVCAEMHWFSDDIQRVARQQEVG